MKLPRILIVDDYVFPDGLAVKTSLGLRRYDFLPYAKTAKEAIERARADAPDLIVMDVHLGDAQPDGLRAAERIRTFSSTPIVFLTGRLSSPAMLRRAMSVSDSYVLKKPFTRDQVCTTVKMALMRRSGGRNIFVCYSREDTAFEDELESFLRAAYPQSKAQRRKALISYWADSRIRPGTKWRLEIDRALGSSKAAILLISPEFLRSPFIRELELPRLLDKAASKDARIYPVLVRSVERSQLVNSEISKRQFFAANLGPLCRLRKSARHACWKALIRQIGKDLCSR